MKTLVAGLGNIFCGDDGFGVAVARRLAQTDLGDGVTVSDFGIRGVHLAYEMLDGWDLVVLVDATPLGEPPGTVMVLEASSARTEPGVPPIDGHDLSPDAVLALVHRLGGDVGRVLVVGCEPADTSPGMDLSPPVAEAVDHAVRAVIDLVRPEERVEQ